VPGVPPAPPIPEGKGVLGTQVPLEPAGAAQRFPTQQSAVVVQAPPSATQRVEPQTQAGVPEGLGTQGRSQQSALEAHAVPGGGGPFALQS
jgi:hypothetical protein